VEGHAVTVATPQRPMPIEIKELHIRVTVTTSPSTQPSRSRTTDAGRLPTDDETTERIVAECVEQVLHILHNKMER